MNNNSGDSPVRQSRLLKTTIYHHHRTWFFRTAFVSPVESVFRLWVLQIRQVPHFCLPRLCQRGGGGGLRRWSPQKEGLTPQVKARGAGAVLPWRGRRGHAERAGLDQFIEKNPAAGGAQVPHSQGESAASPEKLHIHIVIVTGFPLSSNPELQKWKYSDIFIFLQASLRKT